MIRRNRHAQPVHRRSLRCSAAPARRIGWRSHPTTLRDGPDSVTQAPPCNAERSDLAQRFEEVAELLPAVGFSELWEEATERERRRLVEDMLDAVYVHPDHLRVVHVGAPPLRVELAEVGLRPVGMGPLVSEGGLAP